ncbi:MAG: hypothetical protein O7D91_02485 [Planctomycetota bacterium]|nr:hypothetical protein [Planctomycetota bacterium]
MATAELQKLSEAVNAEFRTDEIEIDPLQGVHELSIAPEGIWVRAWVFLSHETLANHGIESESQAFRTSMVGLILPAGNVAGLGQDPR